jgi:hypothetical protein
MSPGKSPAEIPSAMLFTFWEFAGVPHKGFNAKSGGDMSLQYTDLSAPAPATVTVFGGLGSNTTVFAQTPDEIQLAVSDDTVTLVATGRVAAGNDVLASIGKNDSLWTDGATRMSFLNEGTNTSDIIQATGGPAQQSFFDSAVDFKVGDRLLVFGYTGTPNPLLPFPPGVTETAFGPWSELNIDFTGGAAPTGHVVFNMPLDQLTLTHHVSTGSANGVPYLLVT